MADSQHKPVSRSPAPAPRPVADARARALQERIRSLREQARAAGDRLLDAAGADQARLLREWKQAEQACRQAEQEMARLRAHALGMESTTDAPAAPRPPEQMDPDRDWDRREAALAALNLLERAAQPLLNSPVPERGLVRDRDTQAVTPASIDFGPLVEEAPAAPPMPRPASEPGQPTARLLPPEARPTPAARPPAAPAPKPSPVARPPHVSSTRDRDRSRNNTARSGFALALLAGALLGTAILLTLAAWSGHPVIGEWLEQGRHWQQNLQESLRGLTERL